MDGHLNGFNFFYINMPKLTSKKNEKNYTECTDLQKIHTIWKETHLKNNEFKFTEKSGHAINKHIILNYLLNYIQYVWNGIQ